MSFYLDNYRENCDEQRAQDDSIFVPPYYAEKFGWCFQPNRTKQNLAIMFRSAIKDFINPVYPKVFVETKPRTRVSVESKIPKWYKNFAGFFVEFMFGRHDALLVKKCEGQTHLVLANIAIACELFRRKHGELPESLDALAPEFLEKVPNDPFDGKPLRYSKEKKIIYSVGENLIDSGGISEREIKKIKSLRKRQKARDCEDLVFYLTPEEKR